MSKRMLLVFIFLLIGFVILAVFFNREQNSPPKQHAVLQEKEIGEKLYLTYCASCHGIEGQGKKGLGGSLNNPDYLRSTSDKQIWDVIAYGRPQTAMGPALKGQNGVKQLSKEEINQIVSYIRSFQK